MNMDNISNKMTKLTPCECFIKSEVRKPKVEEIEGEICFRILLFQILQKLIPILSM